MIESGDIIKVIDTILCEFKLRKHPWPLHIKSSKFGPSDLSRYWLTKILSKLKSEGCIKDIVALNSQNEWHSAIADPEKDFTISFSADDKKLKDYKNKLLEESKNVLPSEKMMEKLSEDKAHIIDLKPIKFKFNKHTGDFTLNKISGNFPPNGQEYNFIKIITKNKEYQADYLHLAQEIINPTIEKISKANKMDLSGILKNIKQKMKILPKKEAKNKDIFKNQKKFGYRIMM